MDCWYFYKFPADFNRLIVENNFATLLCALFTNVPRLSSTVLPFCLS